MKTNIGSVHEAIAGISAVHAARADGASGAASAVIECIVGAATPMIATMFNGGTIQERLLFALVLAGACSTMGEEGQDGYSLRVEINPNTLKEAFGKFTHLTGLDIRPHLPPTMVKFAESGVLH